MAPSRSNTLSWQQRPSSRGSVSGSVRSRPLSSLASQQNILKPSTSEASTAHESDEDMSRHQVAESLAAKDPSFFKQTQDRGLTSAAYKKSTIETWPDASLTKENRRLPGMVPENLASRQIHESSSQDSSRGNTGSVAGSRGESIAVDDHRQGSIPLSSKREGFAPFPHQHTESRPLHATSSFGNGEDLPSERALAMSPSQGRISSERSERPASPTKGLGGFVQSAMMKRSDSVNKRWSAQAGPNENRENTIIGNRGGPESIRFPVGGITPLVESRASISREATPSANSRPTSSHSNMNSVQPGLDIQAPATRPTSSQRDSKNSVGITVEPTKPAEKITTTPPNPSGPPRDDPVMSPPSSPSKRWSPTKSSWLEKAINKPESPKIVAPSASQQPAWMADFQRNKQQRGDSDPVKGTTFKEVAVGGLIRSPPPGTGHKPPHIGSLPATFRSKADLDPQTGSSANMRSSETPEMTREASKPAGSSTLDNVSKDTAKALPPVASFANPPNFSSGLDRKTKPATPPKMDQRSPAKPKQPLAEIKLKPEPEFKNVFGKLKKTQTQNYVAPDELKDNIMRGKSGLAKTDGPQKSNIRDEFKESILKKKERMIAPSASTKITSASSKIAETSTPEAIAKRQGLGRTRAITSESGLEEKVQDPRAEDLAKPRKPEEMPKPAAPEKGIIAPRSNLATREKPKPGVSVGFASSLAGILQKGPPSGGSVARAPPNLQDDEELSKTVAARPVMTEPSQNGPELTHATKGRARGPKRKPPASSRQSQNANASIAPGKPPLKSGVGKSTLSISSSSANHGTSPDQSDAQPPATAADNTNSNPAQPYPSNMHPTPLTSTSNSLFTRSSPTNAQQRVDSPPSKESTDTAQESKQSPKYSENPKPIGSVSPQTYRQLPSPIASRIAPQQVTTPPLAQEVEESQAQRSVKGLAGTWGRSSKPTQSKSPKSPVKLPTRKDEEAAMAAAGLRPNESVGLGIQIATTTTPRISHQDATSPSTRSPRSPPMPGKKPATIDTKVSSAPLPSPAAPHQVSPPVRASSESAAILTEIFDEPPTSKTNINVNTQAALDMAASSDLEKIKTLRKQIFEIADNGKAVPVPAQQEHILFENSLYVCTHVFGTPAGTRTSETYLWCGDGVSSSAIEDAQLFAKKTAKDNNGKLIVLNQGKETARFFQALGGIVITRKGSSSRSDSATYILCGRQHLGQVAFDEVDFQPQSLCAGFPYIISARGGRLFLWKGSGAGADELGCARLIGMDLGLTGEIEEIDEGKEPPDFWSSFPTAPLRPTNSPATWQHWHLKPSCAGYATKLFTVDVEVPRPKSSSGFMSWGRRGSVPVAEATGAMEARIREITPYSQKDLLDEGVFVLDGFFEIFVYDVSPQIVLEGCNANLVSQYSPPSHFNESSTSKSLQQRCFLLCRASLRSRVWHPRR